VLNSTVNLNQYVQTACLPSEQSTTFPSAGVTGVIAGWGNITNNGNSANLLNNARINVYSDTTCASSFGYDNSFGISYNSAFCAGKL
jgi:hypothetical protein